MQVLEVVARTDLGGSLETDLNNKLQVKTDNSTIEKKSNGALGLKTTSQEFIDAVRNSQSITILSTKIEDGKRYITYQNESGVVSEIDITSFLMDIHTNGMVLEGQVLVTTDTSGREIQLDLGVFTTEEEVRVIVQSMNTVLLQSLGGVPILKGLPPSE